MKSPKNSQGVPGGIKDSPTGDYSESSDPKFKRFLNALAALVSETGYKQVTVADIVARAGLSRADFYSYFPHREAAFLAVAQAGTSRLLEEMRHARAGAGSWPDSVEASVAALLGFVAREPGYARVCFVESLSAGPAAVDHYETFLKGIIEAIEPKGEELPPGRQEQLPETLGETLAGGLFWIVYRHIIRGGDVTLLLPELTEFIVFGYRDSELIERSRKPEVNLGSEPVSLERLLQNAADIRARQGSQASFPDAVTLVRGYRDR